MLHFDYDNEFLRIFSFLKENDNEFTPSLSSRVELDKYAQKLSRFGTNIFVCCDDNDVGHAGFYLNNRKHSTAFLSSFCVNQKQRGSKVATQLLERVMVCAASEGITELLLEVCINNNRAISFYRKAGFVISSQNNGVDLIMKIILDGNI